MSNSDQRDQLEKRLKTLDSRLSNKGRLQNTENRKSDNVNFSNAIRLSTEFVVAILVGVGIGWAFDYFLGTAPWGMIVMLPLGFIAGVRNIMRAAGLGSSSSTGDENDAGDKEDSEKTDRK